MSHHDRVVVVEVGWLEGLIKCLMHARPVLPLQMSRSHQDDIDEP
jgi:hypothetical protein